MTEHRRLEREVIEVVGREQQRLSSDLHEGLGQALTGVMVSLRSAITAIDRGRPDMRALVAEAVKHIGDCIQMARDLARGLSPVHDQLGRRSRTPSVMGGANRFTWNCRAPGRRCSSR